VEAPYDRLAVAEVERNDAASVGVGVEQPSRGDAEPVEGEKPHQFQDERTVNWDTGKRDLHGPSLC
jgi:hypothetical protein